MRVARAQLSRDPREDAPCGLRRSEHEEHLGSLTEAARARSRPSRGRPPRRFVRISASGAAAAAQARLGERARDGASATECCRAAQGRQPALDRGRGITADGGGLRQLGRAPSHKNRASSNACVRGRAVRLPALRRGSRTIGGRAEIGMHRLRGGLGGAALEGEEQRRLRRRSRARGEFACDAGCTCTSGTGVEKGAGGAVLYVVLPLSLAFLPFVTRRGRRRRGGGVVGSGAGSNDSSSLLSSRSNSSASSSSSSRSRHARAATPRSAHCGLDANHGVPRRTELAPLHPSANRTLCLDSRAVARVQVAHDPQQTLQVAQPALLRLALVEQKQSLGHVHARAAAREFGAEVRALDELLAGDGRSRRSPSPRAARLRGRAGSCGSSRWGCCAPSASASSVGREREHVVPVTQMVVIQVEPLELGQRGPERGARWPRAG